MPLTINDGLYVASSSKVFYMYCHALELNQNIKGVCSRVNYYYVPRHHTNFRQILKELVYLCTIQSIVQA
jgi:hypothetical protein